jgi:hypothetical protein
LILIPPMPRFVLLYHDCPPGYERPSHWDLMLEAGDSLETWSLFALPRGWAAGHTATKSRFPNCPPLAKSDAVAAEPLAAHRLAYLEYEGPVREGRGEVMRVSFGNFSNLRQSDDERRLDLRGNPVGGELVLGRESPVTRNWVAHLLP